MFLRLFVSVMEAFFLVKSKTSGLQITFPKYWIIRISELPDAG
jgi:hypothetical protein